MYVILFQIRVGDRQLMLLGSADGRCVALCCVMMQRNNDYPFFVSA